MSLQTIQETTTSLCSTERAEAINLFLAKIEEPFKTAPASSSKTKHDAETGGLIAHILNFHEQLVKLAAPYQAQFPKELSPEALWSVALLHDIRKACDAALVVYYSENFLQSGKLSKDKPYKVNPENLKGLQIDLSDPGIPPILKQALLLVRDSKRLGDGACSLALIETLHPPLYFSLNEDEKQAILWHDGGYGDAKYNAGGKEGILQILAHAADMLASRWNRISLPQTAAPTATSDES